MNAMRQSLRPKHQVLVLKCYPKFQKGVSDVLPNPSELSYLLHYASTRRSKVTKVAAFLEKKSEGDIYKLRVGNVQVTLHIVKALIEKSPRDLPLYAPHILNIFELILKSKNLTLVEESVPAFQALCEHEDTTTLPANPRLAKQFESVVQGYANLAQNPPTQTKSEMSAPNAIRWKMAGLQAIKSITASEAVAIDRGRQLNVVMPVILENLYSDGEHRLIALNRKAEGEKEVTIKRRMSIATNRTAESQADNDKAVVTKTAAESDRMAEEEAGLIAVQSLKQVFVANNRGQIRWATSALLKFLIDKTVPDRPGTANTAQSERPGTWTTTLIEMVAKWTPVQDRFIILITAVENLVKSPITEDNMEKQLILATLIEWLLSSTFNMIGLSILDVLLGLIKHILGLLQFGDSLPTVLPHHEQTEAIDLFKPENEPGNRSSVLEILNSRSFEEVRPASWAHQQLLSRLRKCIGSLATHIYYSDQISDIVSALLIRLRPNPGDAMDGIASQKGGESAPTSPRKDGSISADFFSFGTARVTALNAVKDVIHVANRRGTVMGAGVVGRNRIGLRVWEGTEWLLRDDDKRVRRAYVEALLIWLRLEVTRQDFRILKDSAKVKKRKTLDFAADKTNPQIGRSASSATATGRSRMYRSTFLPLLHLSIYEDALESPETDANILLLHLLMYSLIQKLGVNAVRAGLPMIRRLQEDINTSTAVGTPKAKVNIGSLVHGYFWNCYSIFDFETTAPGYEIAREISRRKKHGLWLAEVQIPPQTLDMIIASYTSRPGGIPLEKAQNESLRPFDNLKGLIDQIAVSYNNTVQSPPSSPPTSPGRGLAIPKVSTPGAHLSAAEELPTEFREAMDADWTKDACLASVEKEKARSSSPTGSKSGTTRSQQAQTNGGLLAVNGTMLPDLSPALEPVIRIDREGAPLIPATHRLRRRSSPHDSTPLSGSSDHGNTTLRVDDLKKALAGGASADFFGRPRSSARGSSSLRNTAQQDFAFAGKGRHGPSALSIASESLVDADGMESGSEYGVEPQAAAAATSAPIEEVTEPHSAALGYMSEDKADAASSSVGKEASPRVSRGSRPRSNSDVSAEDAEANAMALKGQLVPDVIRGSMISDDGVPPVPPLPQNLVGRNSRSSNRQRGEALAPGLPWSGPSSGRSSALNTQRVDGISPLPQLGETSDDTGALGGTPRSPISPRLHSSAFEPGLPRGAGDAAGGSHDTSQGPPPVKYTTTGLGGEQRPDSLLAAANANAAGAAAALAAIAAVQVKMGITPDIDADNSSREDVATGSGVGGRGGTEERDSTTAGQGGSRSTSARRDRDRDQHGGSSAKGSSVRGHHNAGREDNKMLVQALLGSIEVGEMGGKGIGRPPV